MPRALPTAAAILFACSFLHAADDDQKAFILGPQRVRVAQMSTGKPITGIQVAEEGLIKVMPIRADPSRVVLQGVRGGKTTIKAKDKDGNEESWHVTVMPSVLVLVDMIEIVGTSSTRPVAKFELENPKLARLERGVASKSAVRISGLVPGDSRLVLTDDQGKTDKFYVQVRSTKDIDKSTLPVNVGGRITFQMASKKPIILILNEADDVISISTTGSAKAIVLEGKKAGISKLFAMDEDGGAEEYEVLAK